MSSRICLSLHLPGSCCQILCHLVLFCSTLSFSFLFWVILYLDLSYLILLCFRGRRRKKKKRIICLLETKTFSASHLANLYETLESFQYSNVFFLLWTKIGSTLEIYYWTINKNSQKLSASQPISMIFFFNEPFSIIHIMLLYL